METRYQAVVKVEIDVRRPDGTVETVDVTSKFHRLNDAAFANIKAATKAAGRGDAIAYRNITEDRTYVLDATDLVDVSHDQITRVSRMGD